MNTNQASENDATSSEPMVTVRMPLANWRGIVNGLEKWAGLSASDEDMEILQEIELVDGDLSAIWWLNGYYDRPIPPAPEGGERRA